MFLKSIIDSDLLPLPNQNTFHLKNYPTKAIRGLCSSSIPILYRACAINKNSVGVEQDVGIPNANTLVPNYEALKWNIEIIGAAFALPLTEDEDFNIVSTTISLLSIWLHEPKEFLDTHVVNGTSVKSVSPLLNCVNNENKFEFYLSLIKCTTLLFMGRDSKVLSASQKEKHFQVCCRTLKLLTKSIPVILCTNDFNNRNEIVELQEIYNVILRLILGIHQELLSLDNAVKMVRASAANTIAASKSHPYLSRRLAPYLVRAFYEILFISIPIFFTTNDSCNDNSLNRKDQRTSYSTGIQLLNNIFALYILYSKEWWLVGGTNSMYVHYCVLDTITNIIVNKKLWNNNVDDNNSGSDQTINGNMNHYHDSCNVIKINWLQLNDNVGHHVGSNVDAEVFSIFKLWNKRTYISINTFRDSDTKSSDCSSNNVIIYNLWYNLIKSIPDPSIFVEGLGSSATKMLFNVRHKSIGSRLNQLTEKYSSLDFSSAIDVIGAISLKLVNINNVIGITTKAGDGNDSDSENLFNTKYFYSTSAITVLNLFGVYLYQNTRNLLRNNTQTLKYKHGIFKCIKILCSIFNNIDLSTCIGNEKGNNNVYIMKRHVAQFYGILINGLKATTDIGCVTAILVYGHSLLTKNIKENQILLESLINAANAILNHKNTNNNNTIWAKDRIAKTEENASSMGNNDTFANDLSNEKVRISILKIISNMICRSRGNKKSSTRQTNASDIETSDGICEIIRKNTGRILLTFLSKESNEYNLRYAFSILAAKLYEDRDVPGIAQVTISTILSRYFHDNTWNALVKRDAVLLLQRISPIVNYIHVSGTHTIPNMLQTFCRHVADTVHAVSDRIETSIINTNLSNNTTGASANLLKFVEISCLNVIDINNMVVSYVQKAPWLVVNHTAGKSIIDASIKCCNVIEFLESNTVIKKSNFYRDTFKILLQRIEKSGTVMLNSCNMIGKKTAKSTYNYHKVPDDELSSCNYYAIGKNTILSIKRNNDNNIRSSENKNNKIYSNDKIDEHEYNMYHLTLRNSYGRIEWEGIPSQFTHEAQTTVNIDEQGKREAGESRSYSESRLKSRLNYVPSTYNLFLAPEQMTMVKYAEQLLRQAKKENNLSSYTSNNEMKKQVLQHFENDEELYEQCAQTINDLMKRYQEQLKLSCSDSTKLETARNDSMETTNVNGDSERRNDESVENVTIINKVDPVRKMFKMLNQSQEFVVNSNSNNGDCSINETLKEDRTKLFRRQKSLCNLSISTYVDYRASNNMVNQNTSAYSNVHQNHLNRKHVFDASIDKERELYKISGGNSSKTRIEEEEKKKQQQKSTSVVSFDDTHEVVLNRWLLMQIGIVSDSISQFSTGQPVEPMYACSNNPVFIKNIQALDATTIHTSVYVNVVYLSTKQMCVSSNDGTKKMDFIHTNILSNSDAILNANAQAIHMLYSIFKSLGKPTRIGEYDHFVGKQQLYLLGEEKDKCDLFNVLEHSNTETSYKLCYVIPFWKDLVKSHLSLSNKSDYYGAEVKHNDDNVNSYASKACYYESIPKQDGDIDKNLNNTDSQANMNTETTKSYVKIDVVFNDTRMADIIPYITERDINKNRKYFTKNDKYIYEKYVLQGKNCDIEKEDCVTIVVVPLRQGSGVPDNAVNYLCTVHVYANNRFKEKCKYINELYNARTNNDDEDNRASIRDNVFDSTNLLLIGPLISNSIYPVHDLPLLIEQTVVNINNVYNKYILSDPKGKLKTNLYHRCDMIEQIINGKNIFYERNRDARSIANGNNGKEVKSIQNIKYISRISAKDIGNMMRTLL